MGASTYMLLVLVAYLPVVVHSLGISEHHHLYHSLHDFDVLHKHHISHKLLDKHNNHLEFNTLGREFRLLLSPKPRTQGLSVSTIGENGQREWLEFDPTQYMIGSLLGDPDSTVHAHYSDGLLTAFIRSSKGHYYIEPSYRHISQSHDFHMIAYRASDVKYNLTSDSDTHFCGAPGHNGPPAEIEQAINAQNRDRLRRQSTDLERELCTIDLVATYKFHEAFSNGGNVRNSIQFLVSVLDMADDNIYRETVWSEDIGERGLTISNITVYTSPTSQPSFNSDRAWFSDDLLVSFSSHDWGSVCLTHLFTAETFVDASRLGVAYIASSRRSTAGGICSPVQNNFQNIPVFTANTGVSSMMSGSRSLLLAEAKLVVAHEIGHNWGSEHDPTRPGTECNRDLNDGGSYLMFPSASFSGQENNNQFSPCSRSMISDVLRAKGQDCFIEDTPTLCGNYAVDPGEDCDGGLDGMIGLDPCCNSTCHLHPGAECSDINDACCTGCNYAPFTTTCRIPAPGTCLLPTACTGSDKACPDTEEFVRMGSPCMGAGKCFPPDAQCNTSLPCNPDPVPFKDPVRCFNLCEQVNKTQCFCEPFTAHECSLCCTNNTANSSCEPFVFDDGGLQQLEAGSTCLGGVCDADGTCTPLTQDLASRLFDVFGRVNINAFLMLVRDNIVSTVLTVVTTLWIPASLIVYIIDRKQWIAFEEQANQDEQNTALLNIEDRMDVHKMTSMVDPHPHVDATLALKGLQRQPSTDSVYDSLYGDSYVLGSTYFLPNSPMGYSSLDTPARPLPSIAEEADVEKDDIGKHFKKNRKDEVRDSIGSDWSIL